MKNVFRKLGVFIENKRLLLIILGFILIIPAIFGATQLKMETGTTTFISSNSPEYQVYARFNSHFSSNVLVVLLTGDNLSKLLDPTNLAAMDSIQEEMGKQQGVLSTIGPTFFIKQAIYQQTGVSILPNDTQTSLYIVTDPATGEIRPAFSSVFPDRQHALIAITLDGDITQKGETAVVKAARAAVNQSGLQGVDPIITGAPVIWSSIGDLMTSSMKNMLLVSIGLMLLILVLIFHVRGFFAWRWLPLGVVFIGIIYTFGIMGVLSIPITMVTMAVFPILIGLGVDYAIQFHNRYDEESRRGETVKQAIIDAVTHIGPAIGVAIITACLGFAALYFSPVPMIRDFGSMLILGVVVCYILAIFFLLAILYSHDNRRANAKKPNKKKSQMVDHKAEKSQTGFVEKGLHRLAPRVIKSPAVILPIALALCIAGIVADGHIKTETDEMKFISQDIPVIKDMLNLQNISGGFSSANILVEADDVTQPATLEWILQLESQITSNQSQMVRGTSSIADIVAAAAGGNIPQNATQIKGIIAALPPQMSGNLITSDYKAANIIVNLNGTALGDKSRQLVVELRGYSATPPSGVSAVVTGMPVIGNKMFDALSGGRTEMTFIGIAMVFFGLLVLLRFKLLRTLMATLPIALIIGWSSGVMWILHIKYTPLTATLSALIIGIGVEFTILLMMRYYEERGNGEEPYVAMVTAMTKIGRAIVASGLTVIGGFGALLIAKDFIILRDFGIVTMINVGFALVSTLFVLPPLIVLIDSWQSKRGRKSSRGSKRQAKIDEKQTPKPDAAA
jgi:hydrophobe/amphiphile efflux-3 (HAE3) family protein